ncbi:hypothetical protein GCM10023194_12730 [Planotetraspora phitsanulokensis]|uniref:Uncharacterized protein n=1 Tax=Planotetraspora phitsanulokensis TaxID=575192 RepID=A0A8J3U9S2_9ACTN|nr:hypothetical protein [Planotetraspora phitsanulokensis]GII41368.1 hypothetical protein Pph01_63710 [Planotetraspora phitsanulokensis]
MEAVLTALTAVAGTLLGSLLTFVFQRMTNDRAERFTLATRLREERMAVYSGFAGAALEYRGAQYSRGMLRGREGQEAEYKEARAESSRLRASMWHALYRVRLIADDPEVIRLAETAMNIATDMHHAENRDALTARSEEVREAIEAFVSRSSDQLRLTAARPRSR